MIFIFPTELEAVKFRAKHPDAEVIICGVGLAAAAATMATIATTRAVGKRVILAGIAGSYDLDNFPIGSVAECVSEEIEELPIQYRELYNTEARWGLPAARANSVNRSNFESRECDIENMEGAAVAAICKSCGLEFSQIRAISNRVGAPYNEWQIERAVEELTDVLSTIYRS